MSSVSFPQNVTEQLWNVTSLPDMINIMKNSTVRTAQAAHSSVLPLIFLHLSPSKHVHLSFLSLSLSLSTFLSPFICLSLSLLHFPSPPIGSAALLHAGVHLSRGLVRCHARWAAAHAGAPGEAAVGSQALPREHAPSQHTTAPSLRSAPSGHDVSVCVGVCVWMYESVSVCVCVYACMYL